MFFKIVLLQIVLLSAYHAMIGAQSILLALRDKLYHLLETYNSCVIALFCFAALSDSCPQFGHYSPAFAVRPVLLPTHV